MDRTNESFAQIALDTCCDWAKGASETLRSKDLFVFGSSILEAGEQFDRANSDLDLLLILPDNLHLAVDRSFWLEEALRLKEQLEVALLKSLKRPRASESICSFVACTRLEQEFDIHKDHIPSFFSNTEFLSLLTHETPSWLGIESMAARTGTLSRRDPLRQVFAYVQKFRNQFLDVRANASRGLSCYSGQDPLPKAIMRQAALVADGSPNLRVGIDFLTGKLDQLRHHSAETEELHKTVSVRRGARGQKRALTQKQHLLLGEILFDAACEKLQSDLVPESAAHDHEIGDDIAIVSGIYPAIKEVQDEHSALGELAKELAEKLDEADETIAKKYPLGVADPTRGGEKVDFSSERILISLGRIGIPVAVALEIVRESVSALVNLKSSEIATRDIRSAVADSLYDLDPSSLKAEKIQKWGDSYVRRFGDPNMRITVLYENGTERHLTYELIREDIIPALVREVIPTARVARFRKSLTEKEQNYMGEEIMALVRELGLYQISASTLISIVKDTALHPPHPWLVTQPRVYEVVAYDYERAQKHLRKLRRDLEDNRLAACAYSIREAIHHASSALLAYYGVFMGSRPLAPFYNFVRVTKALLSGDDHLLPAYSDFASLKEDLKRRQIQLFDFVKDLDAIHKLLVPSLGSDRETLKRMIQCTLPLSDVLNRIAGRFVMSAALQASAEKAELDQPEFDRTIRSLLDMFPWLEITEIPSTSCHWVHHRIDSPMFRQIKPDILLATEWRKKGARAKVPKEAYERAKQVKTFCNLVVYVSNRCTTRAQLASAREWHDKSDILILHLPIRDLVKYCLENDPVNAIENAIRRQFMM